MGRVAHPIARELAFKRADVRIDPVRRKERSSGVYACAPRQRRGFRARGQIDIASPDREMTRNARRIVRAPPSFVSLEISEGSQLDFPFHEQRVPGLARPLMLFPTPFLRELCRQ